MHKENFTKFKHKLKQSSTNINTGSQCEQQYNY